MPNPTSRQVHADAALTNLSIANFQEETNFVAHRVFPIVPVEKQSDVYQEIDAGDLLRDEMAVRAPGDEASSGGFKVADKPFYCPEYAFRVPVPQQTMQNADEGLAIDRAAVATCTQKALIKSERLFAAGFFTTGVWSTDIAGVAASPSTGQALQWHLDSAKPIDDIETGIATIAGLTGFTPNTLTLGRQVYGKLRNHPDIIARISGAGMSDKPSVASLRALAEIVGVEQVLVSSGVVETAKEGATSAKSFIFGKSALLSYAPPSPGVHTPSAGYTFNWTYNGLLTGDLAGAFGAVEEYFNRDKKTNFFEINAAFEHKRVAADMGYFFSGIVA